MTHLEDIFSKELITLHLSHLTRERDPFLSNLGHFYAKEYIYQELCKLGSVERQNFKTSFGIHENLILEINGNSDLPPILIGAHYDTVPGSPGADDNASGVSVLLELARLLSDTNIDNPVRIIAFDMEEYGMLGSDFYAKNIKKNNERIKLMISLEMIGFTSTEPNSQLYPPGLKYFYSSKGNFIGLIGNIYSIRSLIKLANGFHLSKVPCEWLIVPFRGNILPATRRSDHAAFWDQGYPALMVTDTADLRNPNYHQASDTIDTLDIDFMARVGFGLFKALSG